MDWKDLAEVKRYADALGKGCVVFKHPDRDNYNITFRTMFDRRRYADQGCVIVHEP
jgi:hypothetical protein